MKNLRRYMVFHHVTDSNGFEVEARIGRRFVNIEAALRLARAVRGLVYEHVFGQGVHLHTCNFNERMRQ